MMSKEVHLNFENVSPRDRRGAFQVKRSRTKHLHSKFYKSLLTQDKKLMKYKNKVPKKEHKSEKLK